MVLRVGITLGFSSGIFCLYLGYLRENDEE
mgnify:CR=1 FL=1